jgi:hypothetical protein
VAIFNGQTPICDRARLERIITDKRRAKFGTPFAPLFWGRVILSTQLKYRQFSGEIACVWLRGSKGQREEDRLKPLRPRGPLR